jgi:hypothetical protein
MVFFLGEFFWFLGGKEEFLRFVFMIPANGAPDCRYVEDESAAHP